MNTSEIIRLRLANQQISQTAFTSPAEIVRYLGAMQAQDYTGVLWSMGLRLPGATLKDIEQAINDRTIVRTWPMRGTLHFVSPEDVRWMLALLTPRVVAGLSSRHRDLGLGEKDFAAARELLGAALQGGKQLRRNAIYELMDKHGIASAGQRGVHILGVLAQEGLICFGAHDGKQPTFTLLSDWAPNARELGRDESLATLTKRYFISHGPATAYDFAWWSGLTMADVKAGLAMAASDLVSETIDGKTYWFGRDAEPASGNKLYLLPGFDEYLLGYKDRTAVLHPDHTQKIVPGLNGMFLPTIVSNGEVVGIWKRVIGKTAVTLSPLPFSGLNKTQTAAFATVAKRYGRFLGLPSAVKT